MLHILFMHRLTVKDLSKRFGYRKVLSGINVELDTGDSLAVTGPNGSGKSTFILCLLSQHRPTRGEVTFLVEGRKMSREEVQARSALVSPYLQLYGQLTAEENLRFLATMKGLSPTGKQLNSLLARVGLEGRGHDPAATYSSGMTQRLKYAVALLGTPSFLFLDEPTSNLDRQGKQTVSEIVEEYRNRCIIVIATNETQEYGLARSEYRLGV